MMRASAVKTHQNAFVVVEIFEYALGTTCHTGHRILCYPDAHLDDVFQPISQTLDLGATPGHAYANFHQVSDQFRRGFIKRVTYGIYNNVY
jgi:hypothetical protein